MGDDEPIGKRFSQVYLERGATLRDSVRFRNRLRVLFDDIKSNVRSVDFSEYIEFETGVRVPYHQFGRDWTKFWTTAELRDVLDSITIVYSVVRSSGHMRLSDNWKQTISRFLIEENVGYRLDDDAGVHYTIDEQFARDRQSVISGLNGGSYQAVRHSFESSYEQLDKSPPDTRAAVRLMFDAIENLVKIWFPSQISRLGSSEIEKVLKPVILSKRAGADRHSANLLLNSLADWINAAHQYRHVEGTEQNSPLPLDTTIVFLSNGASYVRWLVELREQAESAVAG